jgi:hypothetical protein
MRAMGLSEAGLQARCHWTHAAQAVLAILSHESFKQLLR